MKKIMFFVSLLAIASLTAILPTSAQESATTSESSVEEIINQDLGVENPGILPTSPFYFIKEWRRGINKFFTFDPIKKAELEVDEINQRAAEMKKLEEIAPQNIEAINKAASNYQKNVEQLKNRLEALKETSQNPNVDKLLDKLIDRSLKHQELFDNLEKKIEVRQEISEQKRTELKEKFEANRERINEVMSKIPEKLEDIDRFKQRLERVIENQPKGVLKELRAVEMLDRVKEKLSEEQQEKIQEVKDRMIHEFEIRMEKSGENEIMRILSPEVLEKLPGNQIRWMEILKEIEGEVNPEMMGKIKQAGEKILEKKIEGKEIRAEEIKKIIQEVKDLIAKVKSGMANLKDENRQSIEKLLGESKFHLQKAENSLNEGKIGEAFGHATAAGNHAKNALRQINREIFPQAMPPQLPVNKPEGPKPLIKPPMIEKLKELNPLPSLDINQLPTTDLSQ